MYRIIGCALARAGDRVSAHGTGFGGNSRAGENAAQDAFILAVDKPAVMYRENWVGLPVLSGLVFDNAGQCRRIHEQGAIVCQNSVIAELAVRIEKSRNDRISS